MKKRGAGIFLIFLIFLFSLTLILAQETNETTNQPQPPTIKCYTDADCGQSSISQFCKDSQACRDENINYCYSPGTPESICTSKIGHLCGYCQYGCKDGECISQPTSTDYCTDPDGTNHFVAGKTCTTFECSADICEGSTIIEYTCKDNRITVDHTYGCINGCQNGACLPETTSTPTGTCVQKGDSCCRGETCETPSTCPPGFILTFKGCDSNCKSLISCQSTAQEQISEQVKCIFANSNTTQKCYLAEYNDKFFCSGIGTCVINVNGYKGQQFVWKSTCGGYGYTSVDGINDDIAFECRIQEPTQTPTQETKQPIPPSIKPYATTWYSIAYWQCYDQTSDKQGGGTSCKPSEVWKKYAEEFCNNHCDKETGKCGVNTFGVYSECSGDTIIQQPVCGNGICESGEGEICRIKEAVACEENKPCRASTGTCYTSCAQDCKRSEAKEIPAKLNEKFNLGVSQAAIFDYQELKINFNDLFVPKCQAEQTEEKQTATIEKYDTITGSVISGFASETAQTEPKCLESEPYAVLQLKYIDKDRKGKTDVIKIRLGEKKQVFDFVISFLDYNQEIKSGLFLVSLSGSETFTCPGNCVCDIYGNTKECKIIEKCSEQQMLCPDGVCREKCEITDITTECKFGCFYQDKCLPYGLRVNGLYCSISNDMNTQLTEEACENNFECESNVCVSGKCISQGLIQRILSWFRNLFGG